MAAKPGRLQIMEGIIQELKGISQTAGYATSPKSVERKVEALAAEFPLYPDLEDAKV